VSAAASVGIDVMAGLHTQRDKVEIVLGLSNLLVEAIVHLPPDAIEQVSSALDKAGATRLDPSARYSLDVDDNKRPPETLSLASLLYSCWPGWFRRCDRE